MADARRASAPPRRARRAGAQRAPSAAAHAVDQLARAAQRARDAPVATPAAARASTSTAVPAVNASASATPTPTTSSAPNPRTIGTGESSRTRKPTAVASAAVAIAGTARAPRRPPRTRAWYWIA